MRESYKKKIKTIVERDPAAFDEAVNGFTDAHDVVEMRFHDYAGAFCVVITYMETKRVPQNIRDEYELRGEYYTCGECPYYEKPTDRRMRHGSCKLANRVDPDGPACLHFYRELSLGEITMERGPAND